MRDYLYILIIAAAVTYLVTPLVRRGSIAIGAMHAPRSRDVHKEPTPLLGGVAMYIGLAAALLVADRLTYLQQAFPSSRTVTGLLLAGGLLVIIGIFDDRFGMGPISKLAGQIAAGGILVWSGAALPWIPWPAPARFLSLEPDLSYTLTILIIVITINAVNFIDGLDGLAAGIVGIAGLAYLIYSYTLANSVGIPSETVPAVASAVLVGMCVGFLPHNFSPARIFMGDTGAMLLGLLLAYGPIESTASLDPNLLVNYSHLHPINRFPTVLPVLVPVAIMIIPYTDLVLAVVRRTRAGKSPFAADRQHLQHRLLNMGHSDRQSVLLLYLWAAFFSGTVVGLSVVRTGLIWLALATVVLMVLLLFATMPMLRPWAASPAGKRAVAAKGRGRSERRRKPVYREASADRVYDGAADGPVPNRVLPDGPVPNRLLPDGPVPNRVLPDGSMPGEVFPDRAAPDDPLSDGPVSPHPFAPLPPWSHGG
jgi:UDP-GlcNAc:undecaprenyl-phosphate/decaprenyl-phosphate GlcNAc-1-phosphate transferase